MRSDAMGMGMGDEKMESITPPGETKTWSRDSATPIMLESSAGRKSGSGGGGTGPGSAGMMQRYLPSESLQISRNASGGGLRNLNGGSGTQSSGVMLMHSNYAVPPKSANGQGPSTYEMLLEQQKLNQHLQHELSKVRYEVEKLRETLSEYEWERQQKETPRAQTRYWTPEEHERFIDALKRFGPKDVRSIASYVGTRNATQVRTHAQKYFLRVQRENKGISTNDISRNRRRCMSEGDLTKVGKSQSKETCEDDGEQSEMTSTPMQASPLSKHPSGIDLLSLVAAETVKNESKNAAPQ